MAIKTEFTKNKGMVGIFKYHFIFITKTLSSKINLSHLCANCWNCYHRHLITILTHSRKYILINCMLLFTFTTKSILLLLSFNPQPRTMVDKMSTLLHWKKANAQQWNVTDWFSFNSNSLLFLVLTSYGS